MCTYMYVCITIMYIYVYSILHACVIEVLYLHTSLISNSSIISFHSVPSTLSLCTFIFFPFLLFIFIPIFILLTFSLRPPL